MKSESPARPPITPLEDILKNAVMIYWEALAPQCNASLVRIEYHVGKDGAVESLKLWARAREYWSLICDYSPHTGWSDGPKFANGYHSRPLGRLLMSIMANQEIFQHECGRNSNAIVEISTPTPEDIDSAKQRVLQLFESPAEPPKRPSPRRGVEKPQNQVIGS